MDQKARKYHSPQRTAASYEIIPGLYFIFILNIFCRSSNLDVKLLKPFIHYSSQSKPATEAEHIVRMNFIACLQEFCSDRYPLGLQRRSFSPFWGLYVSYFSEIALARLSINFASWSKKNLCVLYVFCPFCSARKQELPKNFKYGPLLDFKVGFFSHYQSLIRKPYKDNTVLKSKLEYYTLIQCEDCSLSVTDRVTGRQNGSTEGRMFSRAHLTLMKFTGYGRLKKNHFPTGFLH